MDLAAEAVDRFRGKGTGSRRSPAVDYFDGDDLRISDEELEAAVLEEEKAKKYPPFSPYRYSGFKDIDDIAANCQCPACRKRRGESVENPVKTKKQKNKGKTGKGKQKPKVFQPTLFDDFAEFDEEGWEEEDEFFEDEFMDNPFDSMDPFSDTMPGPSLEALKVLAEVLEKTGGKMPTRAQMEKLIRTDPDLIERILELGPEIPGSDFESDLEENFSSFPSKSSGKNKRKRKKKKR
jgi:hypothetical protein